LAGVGVDGRIGTSTFLGIQVEWLAEQVERERGAYSFQNAPGSPSGVEIRAGDTPEELDYVEPSLTVYVNQLLSDAWALGIAYRFTHSELESSLPEVPTPVFSRAFIRQEADYHELRLQPRWNHSSGWFAAAEALWRQQDYQSTAAALHEESFWQFNVFAGYRLKRQRGELTVGVLNLFDQDYQLHPLSPYLDLPRQRALYFNARFSY
jgi:outer membrane receptor protein involved in Fe transport